ncbi:MAG: HD domain-containing protein [Thermoproteota archaeon]
MRLEKLHQFLKIVGRMKVIKRAGWVSHAGIDRPESVADHSFRCAVLAMCIGDLMNINTEKLIRMLLLHDVQEAITGDYDLFAKKEMGINEVESRERVAIKDVLSLLPDELKARYLSLWEEFKDGITTEAILANDLDKIEAVMQALEYEEAGYDPRKLKAFWLEARRRIKTPIIQDLLKLLLRNEPEAWV